MLTFEYFLVCESVTVDAATNMASLFKVMEQVTLDTIPGVIQQITLVACWRIEPNDIADYQATFRVTIPGGARGGDPGYRDFATNLVTDRRRVRLIQGVLGIPIETPGEVRIDLNLNGHHQASHIITVDAAPIAEQGQGFTEVPAP